MSWFYHVSQGANQQEQPQQFVDMMMPATATASLPSSYYSRIRGPSSAAQDWVGRSSPNLEDLPPAPQGAAVPPSLESLSCISQSAGLGGGPEPISYVTLQEQRCVLSWFLGWTTTQRERFLQDLLGKAVPGKVCTLLDSLSTLQVKDRPPNIFECQLRLWTQWFESWSEEERNRFLHMLEERDPIFVAHFYRSVAGTAGRD